LQAFLQFIKGIVQSVLKQVITIRDINNLAVYYFDRCLGQKYT